MDCRRSSSPARLPLPVGIPPFLVKAQATFRGFLSVAWLAVLLAGISATQAQLMDRKQAVATLLASDIGLGLNTNLVAVWSPLVDLGLGPGHEGALPAAASVAPRFLGVQPFPGPGMAVVQPSYFFWIDDAIGADFMHATRFVLLQANHPKPTVANGGIIVSEQGWWPTITLPDGTTREFFAADFDRVTSSPPGFANPEGLVAGVAIHPSLLIGGAPLGGAVRLLSVNGAGAGPTHTNAAGLIINGSTNAHFASNVTTYVHDLTNQYGVASNRVVVANTNGLPANSNQVATAISNLCALQPPPDKIYIRICSHGGVDAIQLGSDILTGTQLCRLLRPIAAKGAQVCMLIQACHSRSLVDANLWGFPTGSVVIVSADSNRSSHGGTYIDPNGSNMVGSIYSDAFSRCLASLNTNGRPTDLQVHQWVTNQNPCYRPAGLQGGIFSNVMVYPSGDSSGWPTNLPALPANVLSNYIRTTNALRNPRPGIILESLPRLNMEYADGLALLSWSTEHPGFQLEVTSNPTASLWDPVREPREVFAGQFIVQFRSSAPTAFFRLRRVAEDNEPPLLVEAFVDPVIPSAIGLVFSEPLDPASVANPEHYLILSEFGQPHVQEAQLQPDQIVILLFLDNPLVPGAQYFISVNNVTDLAGNPLPPDSNIFLTAPEP